MERARRMIRRHRLSEYLPLKSTAIDEIVARGELKLYPLTEGGRAVAAFEDDVIALQKRIVEAREQRLAQRAAKHAAQFQPRAAKAAKKSRAPTKGA